MTKVYIPGLSQAITMVREPKVHNHTEFTIVNAQALTKEEAEQLFEKMARRYLKMSKAEFLKHLDSGFFLKHPELEHRLDSVLFYLPLIQR